MVTIMDFLQNKKKIYFSNVDERSAICWIERKTNFQICIFGVMVISVSFWPQVRKFVFLTSWQGDWLTFLFRHFSSLFSQTLGCHAISILILFIHGLFILWVHSWLKLFACETCSLFQSKRFSQAGQWWVLHCVGSVTPRDLSVNMIPCVHICLSLELFLLYY